MQKSNEWRAKHKTLWTWPVIGATWRILDYSMSAGDMKVFFIAVSQSKADKPHLRINHRFLCLQPVTTEELKADAVTQSGRKKKSNVTMSSMESALWDRRPRRNLSQFAVFFLRILTVVDFDGCLKCQASSPRSSDHLRRWVDTSVKLSVNTGGRNLGLKAVWLEKVWKHV